jgi:hypothetical protein
MQFPTTVTVLRPSGLDEYGNPDKSFTDPDTFTIKALRISETVLMVQPKADITVSDRVQIDGKTYTAEPEDVFAPRGVKVKKVTLTLLGVQ